jgi:hypothetical protein
MTASANQYVIEIGVAAFAETPSTWVLASSRRGGYGGHYR